MISQPGPGLPEKYDLCAPYVGRFGSYSHIGDRSHNADAAHAVELLINGEQYVALTVVDGIGSNLDVARNSHLAAEVIARTAVRRGAREALLLPARWMANPNGRKVSPDAVAALVVASPTMIETAHVGDCRVYSFDTGTFELTLHTTDMTMSQTLRYNGLPEDQAVEHDNWVISTLARVAPHTLLVGELPPTTQIVIVTSDGVHKELSHDRMIAIIKSVLERSIAQGRHPEDLAQALVEAAVRTQGETHDNATAVVYFHRTPYHPAPE